jgi:hypothetical protein
MLTFKQILDRTFKLVKGYQYDAVQEAVNAAQGRFATEFHMPSTVREYYVLTTVNSTTSLGPYLVYEDSGGVTAASWLLPSHHPIKTHVSGLVDSYDRRIRFRVEGNQLYLVDTGWNAGTYSFWCVKIPTQYVSESVNTNYLNMNSDWREYCLDALSYLIAANLCEYKKDRELAKYYESKYMLIHAPNAKKQDIGDWGMRNSGDQSRDDTGRELEWV